MSRISIAFRVDDVNPVHTRVSVWSGTSTGDWDGVHRARSGDLVLRTAEWEALRGLIDGTGGDPYATDVGLARVEWYSAPMLSDDVP